MIAEISKDSAQPGARLASVDALSPGFCRAAESYVARIAAVGSPFDENTRRAEDVFSQKCDERSQ